MRDVITFTNADVDRFMSFIDVLPNGCWFWKGARSRGKGNLKWYGSFHVDGRIVRAHRFAHDCIGGKPCPPGHHRDHLCRFSLCVRVEHLEAVPRAVNDDRRRNGHFHCANGCDKAQFAWVIDRFVCVACVAAAIRGDGVGRMVACAPEIC